MPVPRAATLKVRELHGRVEQHLLERNQLVQAAASAGWSGRRSRCRAGAAPSRALVGGRRRRRCSTRSTATGRAWRCAQDFLNGTESGARRPVGRRPGTEAEARRSPGDGGACRASSTSRATGSKSSSRPRSASAISRSAARRWLSMCKWRDAARLLDGGRRGPEEERRHELAAASLELRVVAISDSSQLLVPEFTAASRSSATSTLGTPPRWTLSSTHAPPAISLPSLRRSRPAHQHTRSATATARRR